MADPAADELLGVKQVAAIFDVSTETVRNWTRTGKLRYVKLPSGHRRFLRSDVEALRLPVIAEVD